MSDARFEMMPRRAVLGSALSLAAVAATAPAIGSPAFAQRATAPMSVPVDELMKNEGAPADVVIGKPDAPVTIVEYASMTCGHCAAFHMTIYPKLKEKYIDTGKVKFVFRDFPLDNLAAAVSMLSRCVGGEGPSAFVSEMFKRQNEWAFGQGNPLPRLFEIARQTGFTEASFNKCLGDTKLLEQIEAGRKRASEKFGVNSTPTFFINGKKLVGGSVADFEKAIDPLLKS